jgi:hypothetical protein
MASATFASRLFIGFLVVVLFILAVGLVQTIGQSVGHGMAEWLVR